jgi:sigma-E factor negative regulatory protein RseC
MIEEIAVISKIENHQIYVESRQNSACGGCIQKEACATSVLDKFFKKRSVLVDVATPLKLQAGDTVLVAINEAILLRAALLLYLLPLIVMFISTLIGEWLLPEGQLSLAIVAISSLLLSLFLINHYQHSYLMNYSSRPVITRKL